MKRTVKGRDVRVGDSVLDLRGHWGKVTKLKGWFGARKGRWGTVDNGKNSYELWLEWDLKLEIWREPKISRFAMIRRPQ